MANKAGRERTGSLDLLRAAPWVGAALLLSLPLVAMQFTNEVDWTAFDFAIMGVLLFGCCALFELGARARRDLVYRAGVALAVLGAFLLIWINLAVGVIGSEDNPANLMFAGVLAVAGLGAIIARGRAAGMALALAATAMAQALAGVTALVAGWGADGENWPRVIIVLTGFWVALWLVSAWLFRRAARAQA